MSLPIDPFSIQKIYWVERHGNSCSLSFFPPNQEWGCMTQISAIVLLAIFFKTAIVESKGVKMINLYVWLEYN
jgi:hypothetical protein